MKTLIALALACLFLGACASRNEVASSKTLEQAQFEQTQQAQMMDGQAASHVR